MKVSVNWVRKLNSLYQCAADPAPDGIEALVEKIGAQLGAVESVIDLSERYKDIVAVKVISVNKHPGADKLKVCLVDDAGAVRDIPRNASGYVEVVCGAPNVAVSQLVAWIPPGATVPSSFDKEPLVIASRLIRGVLSNGMLASGREMAIGADHEGLLILDKSAKPGRAVAEIYELNDHIIDIENKMFTHRPDCFGMLGVSRELAGIQGHNFVSPAIYKDNVAAIASSRPAYGKLPLAVTVDVPELVPRYTTTVFSNIKVKPSTILMQTYLARLGIRPINNIVDITNYFMMQTGQPLHAYDYDKLQNKSIKVRLSMPGEQLQLLNGKNLTLDAGAVVITDKNHPIGLGGVMGGADTEVDENTTRIVLEAATFDMNRTRLTAMSYGLFTDAVTRFTKNQSAWQNDRVAAWASAEIFNQAGGQVDAVYDNSIPLKPNPTIDIDAKFINSRLGTDLTITQIKNILKNVEFNVNQQGNILKITAGFWRTDIHIREDIVEEIVRLYGYNNLPQSLPSRRLEPVVKNELLEFKNQIRQNLKAFGANEVLTYSFVNGNLLDKVSQDPHSAYKLNNALSPALQYYRLNLLPSLLDKVHSNIKAGFENFSLFEIGKSRSKYQVTKDGLPIEKQVLAMVYAASLKKRPAGAAYFQAKMYLDTLCGGMGLRLDYLKFDTAERFYQAFEPRRSATIQTPGGIRLGTIGEFKESVNRQLKLPAYTAAFEIDINILQQAKPLAINYHSLLKFPQTHQDLCLRSEMKFSYGVLENFINAQLVLASAAHGYEFKIELLDIYQPQNKPHTKQTTWRIYAWHAHRTLSTAEINKVMEALAVAAKNQYNAERI